MPWRAAPTAPGHSRQEDTSREGASENHLLSIVPFAYYGNQAHTYRGTLGAKVAEFNISQLRIISVLAISVGVTDLALGRNRWILYRLHHRHTILAGLFMVSLVHIDRKSRLVSGLILVLLCAFLCVTGHALPLTADHDVSHCVVCIFFSAPRLFCFCADLPRCTASYVAVAVR